MNKDIVNRINLVLPKYIAETGQTATMLFVGKDDKKEIDVYIRNYYKNTLGIDVEEIDTSLRSRFMNCYIYVVDSSRFLSCSSIMEE